MSVPLVATVSVLKLGGKGWTSASVGVARRRAPKATAANFLMGRHSFWLSRHCIAESMHKKHGRAHGPRHASHAIKGVAAADHQFGTDGVLTQDKVREHPLDPVFAPRMTGGDAWLAICLSLSVA